MTAKKIIHQDDHHHGHSLAEDMERIGAQLLARRRAMGWLASGASIAVLSACGGGGSSSGSSSSTGSTTASTGSTASSTGTTGSTTTTGATTTTTTTTSSSCSVADPAETAGPYPGDGTNSASGATSNVLTASGIVRSDIRSSFISSTTTAAGIQVTLSLTLVNTKNNCAPLSGYAIYLWHCDRSGNYSLYSAPTESYLRGVQVTDSAGQVTFTTIFPGCYSGRYPHMHIEIFSSLASATTGRNAVLTTQLAMPAAACNAVYATTGYAASVTNFSQVSLSSDNVFGDNSSAQLALETPTFTGSAAAGYAATAQLAI